MFPEPAMGADAIRFAIQSLIGSASRAGLPVQWGFGLAGIEHGDTHETGHIEVITPGERLPLTARMVEQVSDRVLMLGGAIRTNIYVPITCEGGGLDTPLPAYDFRLSVTSQVGSHVVMGQMPWYISRDYPWALLTTSPIEGWPR